VTEKIYFSRKSRGKVAGVSFNGKNCIAKCTDEEGATSTKSFSSNFYGYEEAKKQRKTKKSYCLSKLLANDVSHHLKG